MSNSNFYIYSNFSDLSVEMLAVTDIISLFISHMSMCQEKAATWSHQHFEG